MRELGRPVEAAQIFGHLKREGERMLGMDTLQYFLGFPASAPYEQSQKRTIEKMALTALFFGQLGLGETKEAGKTAERIREKRFSSLWIDLAEQMPHL